jgi:predicted DNA-binding WGR domain protein
MSAVTLRRTDQTRHMRRFYLLDVQPDLFGNWSFVRQWGRIANPGRARVDPDPTPQGAQAVLDRHRHGNEGKGYARLPTGGTS